MAPTYSDPPTPRGTTERPPAPPKGTLVALNTEWCDITRSRYFAPGKTRTITERITYPAGCTLHFADSQGCLTIRDRSGQVIAAFVGLKRYTTSLVQIGAPSIADDEGVGA